MIRVFLKGNLLLMLLNFATSLCVSRAFGPTGRGILALVNVWSTMVIYWLNCSMPHAIMYFMPRLTPTQRRSFLGCIVLFALIEGILASLILECLAPYIVVKEAARYLPLFRIQFALMPITALTDMGSSVLLGLKENRFWSLIRAIQPVAMFAGLVIILLLKSYLPLTFPCLYWLSLGSGMLYALCVLGRVVSVCGVGRPGEWKIFREALAYGLKSHPASIASSLNQSLDQLLLGTLVGARTLGLYATAVNFTNLLSPISSAATVGVIPHLADVEETKRRVVAVEAIRKAATLLLPGSIGLALAAPVIPLLYGSAFHASVGVALLLLPGVFLRAISGVQYHVVMAFNQPLKASMVEVVGLAVTAPALWLLLPPFGAYGAAMASVLAYTATWAFSLNMTAKVLGVPARNLLSPLPWRQIVIAVRRRSPKPEAAPL